VVCRRVALTVVLIASGKLGVMRRIKNVILVIAAGVGLIARPFFNVRFFEIYMIYM
jgi:hypothetical protein